MRPLLIFIIFIGGLAFVFNNNVIPVANLKALSLLYDLRNSKPTLNIKPDQFNNEIEGYSIRIGSKDKDGHTIRNIVIYDQSSGLGNDKVILAKVGEMIPSADKQYLIFRLKDGWRYEEEYTNGAQNSEQMRMHFKNWDKVFDLSSFKLSRTNEEGFKGAYQMMNVAQLTKEIDSFRHTQVRVTKDVNGYINPVLTIAEANIGKDSLDKKLAKNIYPVASYKSSFSDLINDTLRNRIAQLALANVHNVKGLLDITASNRKMQLENYLKFEIEWHRKFTLSFACILLFLIGAPLGAIIRKGGIGMPLVIAVAFFVLFHITSVTGEKLSKTGEVRPWMGMWMATAMLLPIAFLLISQARNDSQIFSKEWYMRIWRFIKKGFKPYKRTTLAVK